MQQQETILVFRDLSLFLSLNKMLKTHFAERMKIKEKLMWLVKEQTKNKHANQVKIRYIRSSCKLMDWDNFASSFKQVGDALVGCGVIKDDNPNVVRVFQPEQEKVKTRADEKIVIKITDIL